MSHKRVYINGGLRLDSIGAKRTPFLTPEAATAFVSGAKESIMRSTMRQHGADPKSFRYYKLTNIYIPVTYLENYLYLATNYLATIIKRNEHALKCVATYLKNLYQITNCSLLNSSTGGKSTASERADPGTRREHGQRIWTTDLDAEGKRKNKEKRLREKGETRGIEKVFKVLRVIYLSLIHI